MTVTSDGFCMSCRRWALECPDLQCPWCGHGRAERAIALAGLEPGADAAEVFTATRHALLELRRRTRRILDLQAAAAVTLLQSADVAEAARRAHARVATIERAAARVTRRGDRCRNGHERAEHAERVRGHWHCRACAEARKAARDAAAVPVAARRDKQRLEQAWREHEERMAQREAAFATGVELPRLLRPEMPPPQTGGRLP